MAIQYNCCDVHLLHPVKCPFPLIFPYPVSAYELLCDLILVLLYPVVFLYPVKSSMNKSAYSIKINNNKLKKSPGLNYF